MSSDKNDEAGVPAGWELCISKKKPNRKYYFNRKTGDSSWTKPQAVVSPEEANGERCKEETPKGKLMKDRKLLKRKSDGSNTHNTDIKRKNDGSNTHNTDIKRKSDGSNTHNTDIKRKNDGSNTHNTDIKKSKEEKQIPGTPSATKSPARKRASTGSIRESPKFAAKRLQTEDGPPRSPKPTPSPAKRARETPSPAKRARETPNTSRSSHSPKPTPNKNTANARLSHLRAELTADAKNEEAKAKTENAKPQAAKSTPEKKPETFNEPQPQNTHSPSESAQAAISPSQFLAANKIIYSMKAQLPDRDAIKPKNAFADIEEGINNQTTEYPFMKHPATPPQFSEARKLMSAINSKLSYRKEPVEMPLEIFKPTEPTKSVDTPTGVYNVFKTANTPGSDNNTYNDVPVSEANTPTYRSAKDRMEVLRKRLSSEASDSHMHPDTGSKRDESHLTEAMDVDPREVSRPVPEPNSVPAMHDATSKENVILVVDTNIFIHELDFIKNIMNSHIEGYAEQPTLLVPWRVVNELDKLKDSNNGNGAICKRARPAMDYLYKSLPEDNRIKVQPLRDANSHIYPCESPDDEILNCCLQQAERGKSVILLSNDKNLCTKALTNGVETKQLRALVLKPHTLSVASPLTVTRTKKHIYTLLSNILENEMRAKYDHLWSRIVYKEPPWALADVLQCLLKHWMAVFSEVFPRIEYLIMDLRNCLTVIENKGSNPLTQSEVTNFKDLCIEVARRCQIIPEYMQLAKTTVEGLCDTESGDEAAVESEKGEAPVIEAFEGIWTVFSSYCAKLSSNLGVEHRIEDKLPSSDSLEALSSNLSLFGTQISALANSMQGVLGAAVNSPLFNKSVSELERAFKESLTHLGMDVREVTDTNIRIFSTKCRNMLQEAQGKFSELVHLLTLCRSKLGN